MLDTNHCLCFAPSPLGSPPTGDDTEKPDRGTEHDTDAYHSLKEVLQLKLQQRRTREELVSQGIMPPLKSPAAFHEQRRSLERARTEDYLKRKIRSRPERSELVRMHILEETSAEPSLQAKQLQLKRARLADDLNDKISHRPGPIELIHKNILPVSLTLQHSLLDSPKGAGGESSSLDEDSSDALSPDQLTNHDSPLGPSSQLSPSDMLSQDGEMSPSQFLTQPATPLAPPPPPPPPPPTNGSDSPSQKLVNGTPPTSCRHASGLSKTKSSSDRPPQRLKKAKDSKPKVKKLKYHQYIPPDQKGDKDPPPQLDSSYAKILQQQQLFLQLQIINQQQQHYNYHTILPAPPKPPSEQAPATKAGPSPSRSVPTTPTSASANQSGPSRQTQALVGGAKPSTLPANLDEFKVAELKQELKLRKLTVSGTKTDLIERLRHYQEQNGGNSTANAKNATSQADQQGAVHAANCTASSLAAALNDQSTDSGAKVASFSLAQAPIPGRVMRFGSTSTISSPPVSPTASERSCMSPDEASCNGDVFGEMVSSPLTQLSLHPSPLHPAIVPLAQVKEESRGRPHSSCSLSRPRPTCPPCGQPPSQPREPSTGAAGDASALDKDQMLQEKDKQIEELTRMLRQKQRLVETLRSQLEQGKAGAAGGHESGERGGISDVKPQTLIKASAIQPPTLPNGMLVHVKKEAEEGMEGVTDETQANKRVAQPTQCSQETLLKLQQIHRLQLQQAQQQKRQQLKQQGQARPPPHQQAQQQAQQQGQARPAPHQQAHQQAQQQGQARPAPHQQANQQAQHKTEAQLLLQQQQQLQQLIIQQTQQKQLQAQQRLAQSQAQRSQAQIQAPSRTPHKPAVSLAQQKKQQRAQLRQQKQQQTTTHTQQVSPVFGQQNGTQLATQTISLDLLKANGAPTLVTDGNGNHYLIALTNHAAEGQNGLSSLAKVNGRITMQRLLSTPSKLPSQSANCSPSVETQSNEQLPTEPVNQPTKKGQKPGLHLDTNGVLEPSLSVSAPPILQPFFDDVSDSECQSTIISSLKREAVCPSYDRHTLFTPPSPKPNSSLSTQRPKENGLSSQQMDDLFDILLKSGEICGFKANPDPSLAHLHSDPPSPSSPPSPLHLSPPTPPETAPLSTSSSSPRRAGGGRLEDFLESTTGGPLLGVEADGGLPLIDDLHSQMLSTASILEHAPTPMDTSDLGFSPHPAGLDFGDPTLDSMDWLDISMATGVSGAGAGGGDGRGGGVTRLAPLAPHTPPSVFSADFLDGTDLHLHWESCL